MGKIKCNVKYYAPCNLSLKIGEKQIQFITGWSNSYYICTDSEERKALESHKWFNELFFIESDDSVEAVSEKKPVAKKTKVKEIDDIANWQSASEYLINEFGDEAKECVTPPAILSFASSHNIVFTKLG